MNGLPTPADAFAFDPSQGNSEPSLRKATRWTMSRLFLPDCANSRISLATSSRSRGGTNSKMDRPIAVMASQRYISAAAGFIKRILKSSSNVTMPSLAESKIAPSSAWLNCRLASASSRFLRSMWATKPLKTSKAKAIALPATMNLSEAVPRALAAASRSVSNSLSSARISRTTVRMSSISSFPRPVMTIAPASSKPAGSDGSFRSLMDSESTTRLSLKSCSSLSRRRCWAGSSRVSFRSRANCSSTSSKAAWYGSRYAGIPVMRNPSWPVSISFTEENSSRVASRTAYE